MAIAGRHIRHDWQTFVDWEQISVRTLCGRTTKQHLAGVPGVTEQPLVISSGDRSISGWCLVCANRANADSRSILLDYSDLTPEIRTLYMNAIMATDRATQAYRARQERNRQRFKA